MKWSWNHLILVLVFFLIGMGLEYVIYPPQPTAAPKKPTEKAEPAKVVTPDRPIQPEVDPVPDEPAEPEEPEEPDAADEEGDTNPDTEEIKKFTTFIEDDGRRPVQEVEFTGKLTGNRWRNPKTLETYLSGRLRTKIHGTDLTKVREFLSSPENRLMLTQWDLLHRADMDALQKLLSDPKVADSLAPLLNDLPWVSSFVYDGQMVKPEVALGMIYHFRQVDPNMDRDPLEELGSNKDAASTGALRPGVKRRIAAAVAVEFARNNWYGEDRTFTEAEIKELREIGTPVNSLYGKSKRKEKKDIYRSARERYLYFARSWDEGSINTGFGALPDWLMHFVCGWKSDMNSPFGDVGSLRWQRDNVSAPTANYTGMAYQVEYLPLNVFGDTIFTPWYYEPFDATEPGKHSKVVRDVGGVCGSLSHFGASSAVANGVPAITMGEPGHCAYAVYFDDKWHPSNSISEKRGPHWSCWGLYTWSALQMYTAMYQDGQRTRDAQYICSMADLMAAKRNPNNALKLYELSMTMQPLNNPVWTHYLETAAKSLSRSPSKYLGVNDFVCTSVTPSHPEMCAHYLTDIIYPTLLKTLRTPRQKLIAFASYFDHLDQNEKAEWDMEKMLNMQYDSLGKSHAASKENYFKLIAASVRKHPDFGMALSWALRRAYADNKHLGDKVRAMVDTMLADAPAGTAENNKIRTLLHAAVVRAAEETGLQLLRAPGRLNNRERDFYLNLSSKYSQEYLNNEDAKPMPKFTPPNGTLVSPGSMAMLEVYDPDQTIISKHAAAFTAEGGRITSEKGKHVKLIVELPKVTTLGGVVLVPYNGNCERYREWSIETSQDGKTWQLLQKLPDSSPKPCVVVDITRSHPRAKFIRIDSGAEQTQGIDFQAVLIYDNRKK